MHSMRNGKETKLTLIHSGRFTPQPRQSMLRRMQVLHELSTRISSHFCGSKHGSKKAEVSERVDLDDDQSRPYLSAEATCPADEKTGNRWVISVCTGCGGR